MEIQRHYLDANGNRFVAVFSSEEAAKRYVAPPGATQTEPTEPEAPPARTPANTPLTMRQLRLGLLLIGGFSASYIQDAINAIPDATQRGVAQIWYDESATVEWGHPMTQQLIAGAGLTTEQAAAMWMQAKDLDA